MDKKIVVITGASRGLGKAIALKFMNEGHSVVGFSRNKPDYPLSLWVSGDINEIESRAKLFQECIQTFGKVDILVNNAGRGHYETWEKTVLEDVRELFNINFISMIGVTQLFIPELVKTKGTIINTSSIAGKIPVPCMGLYCATKYAVNAFSDSLRIELKPKGVQVLNLIVGRVNTGFSTHALGHKKPPVTPGSGKPEMLAEKVYSAYLKGKKEIIYPGWYSFFLAFIRLFPSVYEYANIKKWGLDQKDGFIFPSGLQQKGQEQKE